MKVILSVPDEGYSERTWWRLFQKRVVRTTFDIYVFIKRVNNICKWLVISTLTESNTFDNYWNLNTNFWYFEYFTPRVKT